MIIPFLSKTRQLLRDQALQLDVVPLASIVPPVPTAAQLSTTITDRSCHVSVVFPHDSLTSYGLGDLYAGKSSEHAQAQVTVVKMLKCRDRRGRGFRSSLRCRCKTGQVGCSCHRLKSPIKID